jgi:hypothetical protein
MGTEQAGGEARRWARLVDVCAEGLGLGPVGSGESWEVSEPACTQIWILDSTVMAGHIDP